VLGRAPVRVTVLDRQNHHLFQPLLYQVATAALSPGDIAAPIRHVLRRQRNTEVLLADVRGIRPRERFVVLDRGELPYDRLVVATGAAHSYFGHPEWAPWAPGLKTVEDALEIRRRILLAFERAEMEPDPVARQAYLNFVIVGGGPTGVELAGALAEIKRYVLRRDFRRIDPREAIVILIEAGKRVLPAYPPDLSEKAKRTLRNLGVDVRTEMMVTEIHPDSVVAAGWRIPAHTIIWAAGNLASPLLQTLGAPLDRQGRVIVGPDCTVPGHPEIFVLGDAANFTHGPEGTLHGVAPVAMQMGSYAARIIADEVRGRTSRPPFHYWNKGELAVIGRGQAVANIWRLRFGGMLAWLAWIFVHIFFLIGFRNRLIVLIEWAISYLSFSRGARLITGRAIDRPPSPADAGS
jgi:NADH dehydrogenase